MRMQYATIAFVQGMRLYHLVLLHLVQYITVMMGSVMPSIIAAMHGRMESIKSLALDLIMTPRHVIIHSYLQLRHERLRRIDNTVIITPVGGQYCTMGRMECESP